MPKAKLRTQAVCESSSSQESLSTLSVKDNLRRRIEQKLVQQNEERFSKSQDNATLSNSLFYSSQCHIGHVSALTWERGWGWLVLYVCERFWWNSYVGSKIVRFSWKMDGPSRNLANFYGKKEGKQCAAFSCSKTFYGPNGLPTSFHFFKLMHWGMYFC